MKTILSILILILINLNPLTAQNFHDEDEDRINSELLDCMEEHQDTHGTSVCIIIAKDEWDKVLNKYYKLLKAELSDDGKKSLLEAQREWLKMRDKEYIFVEQLYNIETGGGTMYTPIYLLKEKDIVKDRALELKYYYKNLIGE